MSGTPDSICIITQLFYPVNQAMAVRIRYIADAMMQKGYKTSVLTSSASAGVTAYKIHKVLIPVATNQDRVYIRLLKELLFGIEVFFRVLFNRSDMYFITSPPFTIAFFAVLACRLKIKPYIFDVRDEYPEVYFSEGLINEKGMVGKMLKRIEKWIYRNSHTTLTVTDKIVQKLISKSGQSEKIYLLRNGFADHISPVKALSTSPFVVLFHGNMGKFQRPQLICEVAQLCYKSGLDIEFWVYGWGNQSDIILEAQKTLPNLHHKGEISHQEMPQIIAKASLGISFQGATEISRNSFPSKVMEFIGSGIPVIVTPISEAGEFVEKHRVGFQFEPNEAALIYECIKRLYENPEEMLAMNKRAISLRAELSRKSVSTRFVETVLGAHH